MLLSKKIEEDLLKKYEANQPVGGAKYTPRLGYYLIKRVFDKPWMNELIPMAEAYYKENEKDEFMSGVIVTIQLMSLQGELAVGPKHIPKEELVEKVIRVTKYNPGIVRHNNKGYPVIMSTWDISNVPATIANPSSLVLSMIMSNASNLTEAVSNFQSSLGSEIIDGMRRAEDDEIGKLFIEETEDTEDLKND